MATIKKSEFRPAKVRGKLTPADMLRMAREYQNMTQTALAKASGVPQSAIAGIESGRVALRADRAEKLARALKVHPAVLLWPQWEDEKAARTDEILRWIKTRSPDRKLPDVLAPRPLGLD